MHTRVGCLVLSFSVCLCAGVFVCHHDSTFFCPRLATALDAHGTNPSPGGLCARTHTKNKLARAGAEVRFSQLVELGAATRVARWLAHGCKKQNRKISNGFCFFGSSTKRNTTLRVLVVRPCLPTATFGPCPKTCCRWCCQAHRPATTDEGTGRQEKLCCRCGTYGSSSVVAPVTTVFVFRVLP